MTKRQDYLAKLIKTTYCRHLHVPNITQIKNEKWKKLSWLQVAYFGCRDANVLYGCKVLKYWINCKHTPNWMFLCECAHMDAFLLLGFSFCCLVQPKFKFLFWLQGTTLIGPPQKIFWNCGYSFNWCLQICTNVVRVKGLALTLSVNIKINTLIWSYVAM
jgi:hypothetical protein